MTNISKAFYFSLPVQLVMLQLRKNYLLLFFWAFLFAVVNGWGIKFGMPYLFFEPEYLTKVNALSFFLVGMAFGGFLIAYNTANYIAHLKYLVFIGYTKKPFLTYCLNNAIIPLVFICFYGIKYFAFTNMQNRDGLFLGNMLPFCLGIILVFGVGVAYFFNTNSDILKVLGKNIEQSLKTRVIARQFLVRQREAFSIVQSEDYRVDSILTTNFKWLECKNLKLVNKILVKKIFRQNQINAIAIQSVGFALLLSMGIFSNWAWLQFPAASSILLSMSVFALLLAALNFWFGQWRTTVLLFLFLFINSFFDYMPFQTEAKVYGLDYRNPVNYGTSNFKTLTNNDILNEDSILGIQHLTNWKNKFNHKPKKPSLIVICASGGGLRSAFWTSKMLQLTDSLTNLGLMNHTVLITGASGGVLGATFYRELYLRNLQYRSQFSLFDPSFIANLGRDLLNPIFFTIATNDLFFSLRSIKQNGFKYRFDRATALEKGINDNTFGWFKRPFLADSALELSGKIPRLLLTPTLANDGRRLLISALPTAYLAINGRTNNTSTEIDGVEFFRMFRNAGGANLNLTTALRLSATFPYITPNAKLPTKPSVDVVDAGLRDNFGIDMSIRYLFEFKDWIHQNVDKVVLLQFRDTPDNIQLDSTSQNTWAKTLLAPVNSLARNWKNFQEYNLHKSIQSASTTFPNQFEWINMQLIPEEGGKQVSLSWHLTESEKSQIDKGLWHPQNQKALKRLQIILTD